MSTLLGQINTIDRAIEAVQDAQENRREAGQPADRGLKDACICLYQQKNILVVARKIIEKVTNE